MKTLDFCFRSVMLSSAILLSACGGDSTAPPTAGTIAVNVVTTGVDIDDDGFLLSVDGGAPQPLPANGRLTWSGSAGSHTLAITGLAFNCDLATAPPAAGITLGQTTAVDVSATCAPYLRNTIVYTSEAYGLPEVMVARADGSRQQRLTTDQTAYASPAVSPNGQSIAIAAYTGGSWNGIYLLDRFGKSMHKLVTASLSAAPAWSPDGTKLAFRSERDGPNGSYGRIFIVNSDGSGLRQLTPQTTDYTFDDGPSWSPDGTQLVYSHNGTLMVINADGTSPTSLGISGSYPSWSRDGTKIVFHCWNAANTILVIFVADKTGANRHQLTTPDEGDQMPRWSPDGREIIFQRIENQKSHLYKMAADGSGVTKFTTQMANESWPSWTPPF